MAIENKAASRRLIDEVWSKFGLHREPSPADLTRRILEGSFGRGDFSAIDECVAYDYLDHDANNPFPVVGPEGLKRLIQVYRSAFPDLTMVIEDQVAEGNKVMTRWKATGTHRGELLGIPPTGKRVSLNGITEDRYAEGKLCETWGCWDSLGMMQQLGVVPLTK